MFKDYLIYPYQPKMFRLTTRSNTIRSLARSRFYSSKVETVKKSEEVDISEFTKQSPNFATPWSPSQRERSDLVNDVRFVQHDLESQPRAYSAMELIHRQPVRYIEHGNVAVCNGNKGRHQGHPKVFINLDQPKASTCC